MPPKKKPAVVLPDNKSLKDVSKRTWKIGERIGVGGFGEVFLCQEDNGRAVGKTASHVIKIEPSASGPLYCEMQFYTRTATKEMIDNWVAKKKLDYLGMSALHAKGQYDVKGSVYRYLIIDRYSSDLEALQQSSKLPLKTALTVGVRMLEVLEYIHSTGYIHADIKASNIMLGLKDKGKVYLCDFGLAAKFTRDDGHKEEKGNKDKKHDGTIEYTSRDAHKGMGSRRSDIEILAFNLLHWMSGKLPWLGLIKNCDSVAASKEKYMSDIKGLITYCFGKTGNTTMEAFLNKVNKLDFQTEPDYEAFKKILKDGLKAAKIKYDGKIEVESPKKTSKRASSQEVSDSEPDSENKDEPDSPPVVKRRKQATKKTTPKDDGDESSPNSSQENMTPAMRQVMEMKQRKEAEKSTKRTRAQKKKL